MWMIFLNGYPNGGIVNMSNLISKNKEFYLINFYKE